VLEAMACGTPVIAADATALPATAGGAARLAAPDGEAFAAAVREVLGSPAEHGRLREAGLERAAPFTWDRTARAVDALLSERAASPRAGTR
jgi:glycosyltransferase involved in cell wall biosynthesis